MDPTVTYQGNLVADPFQRVTSSGAIMTTFRIASNNRRLDRETGEWVDGASNFISVTCWRQLGSHVVASLRKGDSVVVHGRLVYREYDDRNNVRHREHEVDAVGVGPDLCRWAVDIRRPAKPRTVDGSTGAPPEVSAVAPAASSGQDAAADAPPVPSAPGTAAA